MDSPVFEEATGAMQLGIDLDNTLICYDDLFRRLAWEAGALNESIPPRKDAVRDALRQAGQEPLWTALQGLAYGPRLCDATPFPGIAAAFAAFHARGWRVAIVSHKTRTPYAGPAYDLHQAARDWLAAQPWIELVHEVFLEETKSAKLQRIASLGCDWFIDDLPELLTAPEFPAEVRRVLFDPHRQSTELPGILRLTDWHTAAALLSEERPI